MDDFIYDHIGKITIAVIVALLALLAVAVNEMGKERHAFMTECQQDLKKYECDAMWRAGRQRTVFAPMPMVVPVR